MPTVFVHWYPGRTTEQKQKIARRITDALVEDGHAKRESILIIFQEMTPDNVARAGRLESLPQQNSSDDSTAKL